MRAALGVLGQAPGARWAAHRRAGRHARARAQGPNCMADLPSRGRQAVRLVFCSGPLMARCGRLFRPSGAAAMRKSAALEAEVWAAVRAGDAVMVKGSLGSKMGPIVRALTRQYSCTAPCGDGTGLNRCSIGWPTSPARLDLQRLPLSHVPHRRSDDDGADPGVPVRPGLIDKLRASRAKASRSAPTARSPISSPRRARPPWAA